jgi:SAM-dependent methyltransferase
VSSATEKKFLHVGCGTKRKLQTTRAFASAEWRELRLDIDPAVEPDIVGSMTDMSAVPAGSCDALFSSHNIEHLYPHEVPVALREFLRVLRPTGFVVITCPDLQAVCKEVAEDRLATPIYHSAAGPIAAIDMLYGHRLSLADGNLHMAHRCGFTQTVLRGTLRDVGFKSIAVDRKSGYALWAVASVEPLSEAALDALARDHFPV